MIYVLKLRYYVNMKYKGEHIIHLWLVTLEFLELFSRDSIMSIVLLSRYIKMSLYFVIKSHGWTGSRCDIKLRLSTKVDKKMPEAFFMYSRKVNKYIYHICINMNSTILSFPSRQNRQIKKKENAKINKQNMSCQYTIHVTQ